jgi:6,7-dimethyl-8-ribityllumazine synthase
MRKGSLEIRSGPSARGRRFAVVASLWNEDLVDRLLEGARSEFARAGVRGGDLCVSRVPGAFELVAGCRRAVRRRGVRGVVALGCLLRGDTLHFEVLAHSVAGALAGMNAGQDVPIAFGVLTCETRRQALDRSGGRTGNLGAEAARAALAMARSR